MRKMLLGTTFVAVCFASSSLFAASDETAAFVANVRVNAVFLGEASRLAGDRSENSGLQVFAGMEVGAERTVIADIDRHTPSEMVQAMPTTLASNEVITGRSAAVDGVSPGAPMAEPVGIGALMPAASITLDHLSASKGHAFDMLYKATQINALRQLAGLYGAYALTGDDAALKQAAKTELAGTNDRIAAIGRL